MVIDIFFGVVMFLTGIEVGRRIQAKKTIKYLEEELDKVIDKKVNQ